MTMRRRPIMPPSELQPRRMDLESAMRLYCEKRKIGFGVLYRGRSVRVQAGRRVCAAHAKLTFGRKHACWQVCTWTFDCPDCEDRLYNNLTRVLDRKLRELGWHV